MDIRLLLAPLAPEDVKTVRCLGLNYEQHAKEVHVVSSEIIQRLTCVVQHANSLLPRIICKSSIHSRYLILISSSTSLPLPSRGPRIPSQSTPWLKKALA